MCDKSCPDFGKCEKCRHGEKTGETDRMQNR